MRYNVSNEHHSLQYVDPPIHENRHLYGKGGSPGSGPRGCGIWPHSLVC